MEAQEIQKHMEAEQAAEVVEAPVVEAPSEEASAPEASAEPAPVEKRQPDTVPLAVHLRERERHRREVEERDRLFAEGQRRLDEIARRLQPQEQAPADDDILGQQSYALKQANERLARMERDQLENRQRQEVERSLQQLVHAVKQDEAAFTKETPDYADAVEYAKQIKKAEYLALGVSEQEAEAQLYRDALAIAQRAYHSGSSPAEFAYNLAKALGYQGKKAEAPANVVAMRQAGQKMATGGGGGSGKTGAPSFAELAAMSAEEFAEATKGNKWKKLAG